MKVEELKKLIDLHVDTIETLNTDDLKPGDVLIVTFNSLVASVEDVEAARDVLEEVFYKPGIQAILVPDTFSFQVLHLENEDSPCCPAD